jgi:uncharacterized DUF497 family protein
MEFEFDPDKSLTNKAKHEIDFDEAQELWKDGGLAVISAKSDKEARLMAIGMINNRFWSAIHTMRGDVVRLISVRRSRQEEIDIYESSRKDH